MKPVALSENFMLSNGEAVKRVAREFVRRHGSPEALRVLREVDLIACEETRHTQKLLNHFGIAAKTISYHEHNERERAPELCELLVSGKDVALVSDAGTPLISDPGFYLTNLARASGIPRYQSIAGRIRLRIKEPISQSFSAAPYRMNARSGPL